MQTANNTARILLFSSMVWYFAEGMIVPFFGILAQSVGGDILDISWVWATYMVIAGIFTIIVGKISDERISKEKLLVVGYALNAIFTFGYLLVSSTWHLFFVQAGLGIASALATPTWNALYANHNDRRSSGMLWGLADGQEQIVTGIATAVGGLIIAHLSFTALFVLMGIIQTLAALYQAQLLFYKPPEPAAEQLPLP